MEHFIDHFELPELHVDLLKTNIAKFYHAREVMQALEEAQWKHLGWLNNGIQLPYDVPFEQLYKNPSGSYVVMGNWDAELYYCVDMGD